MRWTNASLLTVKRASVEWCLDTFLFVTCSGVQQWMGTVDPKLAYALPSGLWCSSAGMDMLSTRPRYVRPDVVVGKPVRFDILGYGAAAGLCREGKKVDLMV